MAEWYVGVGVLVVAFIYLYLGWRLDESKREHPNTKIEPTHRNTPEDYEEDL